MIRIITDGDNYCPMVFCDVCEGRIVDGDGCFARPVNAETPAIAFLHARCKGDYQEAVGLGALAWVPIAALPQYLIGNLETTVSKSQALAKEWSGQCEVCKAGPQAS